MYEAEEIHNKSLIYRGLKYIKAADEQLMAIKDNNGMLFFINKFKYFFFCKF